MQLLAQKVKAKDVMEMISARLANIDLQYRYATGGDDKMKAEVYAEAKWELAELKMQFVDLLIKQLEDEPENSIAN